MFNQTAVSVLVYKPSKQTVFQDICKYIGLRLQCFDPSLRHRQAYTKNNERAAY
jgi:hypothetical protein